MQTESRTVKERIPWLMAGTRALLGAVMVLGERARWNGVALAVLVVTALLSDIFDGVLARRWKCDTAAVRVFDSMADIMFYAGCAIALGMRHPGIVHAFAVPIAIVAGLEVSGLVFALRKFGKLPSYHSYLAKTWGLALASALVVGFVTKQPSGWIAAALALGALCNVEGLLMSAILPVWRRDVKTLAEACRLRGIARQSKLRFVASVAGAAMVLFAMAVLPLHAQKPGQAVYETGTTGIAANTTAPMMISAQVLRFEAPTPLAIPYERIDNVEWRKDVREHMGFFPAMFVGMVAAREHIYRLTLSYHDDSGVSQVAVFQVNRNDAISLSELLRMRVPQCREKARCLMLYDE
ncbi:MAG TPA: CDP-alcohol phosphatidyltransferase family protein [Candidatus Aquilonibacter sp.]|nr:CDP-alcohol phosphatidyltransferase family protein [Candidatus Aquilonibacter sp.]